MLLAVLLVSLKAVALESDRRQGITVGARVASSPEAEPPVLFVRDNGMGIDRQYHEKVFELFERLDEELELGFLFPNFMHERAWCGRRALGQASR